MVTCGDGGPWGREGERRTGMNATQRGRYGTECTASSSASSPGPPASSPESSTPSDSSSAQEKKETAEKTRDSILADIADPALKKKAKLLADAAIAGETVQRLSAKLSAADADAACASAYSKAAVSSGKGACVAKPDTSAAAGRRRLSATTYNVELMFKSSEVSRRRARRGCERAQGQRRGGRDVQDVRGSDAGARSSSPASTPTSFKRLTARPRRRRRRPVAASAAAAPPPPIRLPRRQSLCWTTTMRRWDREEGSSPASPRFWRS